MIAPDHLGQLAALGTAFCWVFTSLAFAAASRRIGPLAVNLIRLHMAVTVLLIVQRLWFGSWWPDPTAGSMLLLAASGVVGLAIGDQLLFTALVDVGPRVSSLLMTLAPPVAAAMAWPLLDEPLSLGGTVGIALTLSGIAVVVLERPSGRASVPHPRRWRGIAFAAAAAACQGIGLVLAKLGIGHTRLPVEQHLEPWSATLLRMMVGAAALLLVTGVLRLLRRRRPIELAASIEAEHLPPLPRRARGRWGPALAQTGTGALFGPVVGVWLSLVAVDLADAGIAATLMAMTPVFILPFAVWIEKERLNRRAITGAMIAVAGVAVLMAR